MVPKTESKKKRFVHNSAAFLWNNLPANVKKANTPI